LVLITISWHYGSTSFEIRKLSARSIKRTSKESWKL